MKKGNLIIEYHKKDYVPFITENRRKIKHLLRSFIFAFPLLLCYVYFGALLFFYIEHCLTPFVDTKKSAMETSITKLCNELKKQSFYQSKNKSIGLFNSTVFTSVCDSTDWNKGRECRLTVVNFFKWTEFTMSVCFTVGYGNVVPLTDNGKIATIFYAIPGLGIAVVTYSIMAKILLSLSKMFIFHLEFKILHRSKVSCLQHKTIFMLVIMITCVIFTQAAICTLYITENYRFLDAIYYVFISITTIGFGDFDFKAIAYHKRPDLFISCVICYFGGFSLTASLCTAMAEVLSDNKVKKIPRTFSKYILTRIRRKHKLETMKQRKNSRRCELKDNPVIVNNRAVKFDAFS